MYKIEVELKQHTPMIHFQSNQVGYGLRASDVKPRLDKYILKFSEDFLKNDKDGILAVRKCCAKKASAPYSLHITSGKPLIYDIDSPNNNGKVNTNTPYFGEIKKYVLFEHTTLLFRTLNESVKDCIVKTIPYLFAFENFGIRQNKGFGSFTVDKVSVNGVAENTTLETESIYTVSKTPVYKYELKIDLKDEAHLYQLKKEDNDITKTYQILFQNIKFFYNTLKSGVNMDFAKKDKTKYSKSLLFKYYKNIYSSLVWEKRVFKLEHGKVDFDATNTEYRILRHVLGLAEQYTFTKSRDDGARMDVPDYGVRRGFTENNDKITFDYNTKYSLKDKEFDRITSPILIKPIRCNEKGFLIYISLKKEYELSNEDLGKISFSVKKETEKPPKTWTTAKSGFPENYSLKGIEKFDYVAFLEYVFDAFATQHNNSSKPINKYVASIKLIKIERVK